MAFAQHAEACKDHANCTVIVGVEDGREIWWSHMHSSVDPAVRIGSEERFRRVEDRRGKHRKTLEWRPMTKIDALLRGLDVDTHRALSALAVVNGAGSLDDVAAAADFMPAALVAEAEAWAFAAAVLPPELSP